MAQFQRPETYTAQASLPTSSNGWAELEARLADELTRDRQALADLRRAYERESLSASVGDPQARSRARELQNDLAAKQRDLAVMQRGLGEAIRRHKEALAAEVAAAEQLRETTLNEALRESHAYTPEIDRLLASLADLLQKRHAALGRAYGAAATYSNPGLRSSRAAFVNMLLSSRMVSLAFAHFGLHKFVDSRDWQFAAERRPLEALSGPMLANNGIIPAAAPPTPEGTFLPEAEALAQARM